MLSEYPLVVLGAGGHASILIEILLEQKREIAAVCAPEINLNRSVFKGLKYLSNENDLMQYSPCEVRLVNGIGFVPGSKNRMNLGKKLREKNYSFETVISNTAQVSVYSDISEGVQILTNAVINTGAIIGKDTIINSGAIVEHDCILGQIIILLQMQLYVVV